MSEVFKTPRPMSSDERLAQLVHNKEVRQRNLKILHESTKADQVKKDLEEQVKNAGAGSAGAEDRVKHEDSLDAYAQKTAKQRAIQARAGLKDRLVAEGVMALWDKVLFETIYNAAWVDSEVKETLMGDMFESYCELMEGISEIVPETITKSPNRFLQEVHRIVVETAECVAKRACEEYDSDTDPQKDPDKLNFSLTDQEEASFTEDIASMSPEEIEEAVKNKVLAVIQDEKVSSKNKAELMSEIDEAKKEEDDSEEEIPEDESIDEESEEDDLVEDNSEEEFEEGESNDANDVVEESLYKFNDTVEDSAIAMNGVGNQYSVEDAYADAERYRISRIQRSLNDPKRTSLFEALMINARAVTKMDALLEGLNVSFSEMMDGAMVSAVVDYTVLETLSTVGLCEFNSISIGKLKDALLEGASELLKKDPKVMSLDETGKKKKVRIGTKKFKVKRGKEIFSAHTDSTGKRRKGGFKAKFANAFKK